MKPIWILGSFVLLGAASGLVGALCGVGGGIILVPAFKALGIAHKTAIATSLAVIIPTSLMATVKNQQAGLVDWKVMIAVAVGAVIAAYFGSELMQSMRNALLVKIFAFLLIATGVQMLLAKS